MSSPVLFIGRDICIKVHMKSYNIANNIQIIHAMVQELTNIVIFMKTFSGSLDIAITSFLKNTITSSGPWLLFINNSLLSWGFVPVRFCWMPSTETHSFCLLRVLHDFLMQTGEDKCSVLVQTDLSTASDIVNHPPYIDRQSQPMVGECLWLSLELVLLTTIGQDSFGHS